ncbi:unnamed protein product [Strongylus vulgaris]|uniref:Uncharacterized protein n=1 Tax=Strongylus vulgaris TaxID=40348 RepID=A0A3P7LFK4_STRVU|nr:unnamed protein product [Strongylus vulgaris]
MKAKCRNGEKVAVDVMAVSMVGDDDGACLERKGGVCSSLLCPDGTHDKPTITDLILNAATAAAAASVKSLERIIDADHVQAASFK